ncbi:MAG: hypothetical protein ACPG51_08140, partial [Thiolinea sp.]
MRKVSMGLALITVLSAAAVAETQRLDQSGIALDSATMPDTSQMPMPADGYFPGNMPMMPMPLQEWGMMPQPFPQGGMMMPMMGGEAGFAMPMDGMMMGQGMGFMPQFMPPPGMEMMPPPGYPMTNQAHMQPMPGNGQDVPLPQMDSMGMQPGMMDPMMMPEVLPPITVMMPVFPDEETEQQIEDQQQTIEDLEKRLTEVSDDSNATANALQEQLTSSQDELSVLEAQVADIEAARTMLQEKLAASKQALADLQEEARGVEQENTALNQQIKDLTAQVETIPQLS